jgi:DEAD/DEAH box helicase domain-containing protein
VFTSGVCLTHPALERPAVDLEAIASLLLEAFLVVVPLERQDVDVDHGSLRGAWGPLKQGQHFLCLFDQASGSLRLTSRLRDPEVLRRVVVAMSEMIADRHEILVGFEAHPIGPATRAALKALLDEVGQDEAPLDLTFEGSDDSKRPVLLPTSRATSETRPGEVFEVHKVLVHLTHGLSYRGVWVASAGTRTEVTIPVFSVEPLAGQSKLGTFDVETGEIAPA